MHYSILSIPSISFLFLICDWCIKHIYFENSLIEYSLSTTIVRHILQKVDRKMITKYELFSHFLASWSALSRRSTVGRWRAWGIWRRRSLFGTSWWLSCSCRGSACVLARRCVIGGCCRSEDSWILSKGDFDRDFLFNTESFFIVPRTIGDTAAEETVELKAGGGKSKHSSSGK